MFVHSDSEVVHVVWAGVWTTAFGLLTVALLGIFAPRESILILLPAVSAIVGPAFTLIGMLLARQKQNGNGRH